MSTHADKAIRQAFEIARQFGSEVFMLHVTQDHVQQCTGDYCIEEGLVLQLQTQILEGARKGIEKQLERISVEDRATAKIDIKSGVPYDEILKEADERGVDLIVISSLGTTGLAKYVIGSVARHILLGAKCSVLLVK
jgi:nucleotide-binding universal stress UspA family protein